MLVSAVNSAIERGLLSLDCEPVATAKFEFALGPYPIIASINDIGYDEVAIKVIACPTELGQRNVCVTVFHEHRRFGKATTFGWLERRDGKYLQSGVDYYGSSDITLALSKMSVTPNGFGTVPVKGGYDNQEFRLIFG